MQLKSGFTHFTQSLEAVVIALRQDHLPTRKRLTLFHLLADGSRRVVQ